MTTATEVRILPLEVVEARHDPSPNPPQAEKPQEEYYWAIEGNPDRFNSLELIGKAMEEGKLPVPQQEMVKATRWRETPASLIVEKHMKGLKTSLLVAGIGLAMGAPYLLSMTYAFSFMRTLPHSVLMPLVGVMSFGLVFSPFFVLGGLGRATSRGTGAWRAWGGTNRMEPLEQYRIGVVTGGRVKTRVESRLGEGETWVAIEAPSEQPVTLPPKIVAVQKKWDGGYAARGQVIGVAPQSCQSAGTPAPSDLKSP